METKQDFVAMVADITRELDENEWNDPYRFFGPTLEAMARDSARWIENEWKAGDGSTTPVERAIVVLTQDLIVLLGHSVNAEIKHDLLNKLARVAVNAAEAGLIEDQSHRDYFLLPDSPLQKLIMDVT
ncbi:MAG: hypothetical protein VCC01_07385 [Candidatus Hydrogenedentota bacterium]